MSIRVYRPLSLEAGRPPYRPLLLEVGACYYHAKRVVRDMYLEFWANPCDLTYVGAFVEEVGVDEPAPNRGARFVLDNVERVVHYTDDTCLVQEPPSK
jgi:hypothetical protein